MADSTKGKDKSKLDDFNDDLDAMLDDALLNVASTDTNKQVGLIDDDDVIDRLLVGDDFQESAQQVEKSAASEIDDLMADDFANQQHMEVDLDEFSEISLDLPINPNRQQEDLATELDDLTELTELDIDNTVWSDDVELDTDEFSEISEIDLTQTGLAQPETAISETPLVDEFSPEPDEELDELIAKRRNSEPEISEFDISADDQVGSVDLDETIDLISESVVDVQELATFATSDIELPEPAEPIINLSADDSTAPIDNLIDEAHIEPSEANFSDEINLDDPIDLNEIDLGSVLPDPVIPLDSRQESLSIVDTVQTASLSAEDFALLAEHTSELAGLTQQLTGLKKQQLAFRQEMTEKAGKLDLTACLEELESIKAEQKKTKRAVDGISNQKPVLSYVGVGVSVAAILMAIGLGVEAYITHSQLNEFTQLFAKLQEQITSVPNNDAAEKEMLRKDLDALSLADTVANNQIAEIKKSLSGNASGSDKPSSDYAKQLNELTNQDMQIGASIEKLDARVATLEKSRTQVQIPVPKPEKKVVVIEENWAVNLIAFKQDWYAKRKAEEYARQGIPAKVSKTVAKGEDWYRLSVDGFKSQYEAAGYAARVKKSLNLDSVWVAKASAANAEQH